MKHVLYAVACVSSACSGPFMAMSPLYASVTHTSPGDAESPILKSAVAVSANKCSAPYADLGAGITDGAKTSLTTMRGSTRASSDSISAVAGLTYGDPNVTAAAGTIFVAPTPTGFQGQAVRVVSFKKTCDEMAKIIAKDGSSDVKLEGVTLHNMPQGQAIFVPGRYCCTIVNTITAVSAKN